MSTLTGGFELASWDEQTTQELEGERKLTRADVTQTFTGDLEGEGSVTWLMSYAEDGTAHFVGMQLVRGVVDGRKGAVVMETIGDFDGTIASGTWTVIPGSATGDLAGMTGRDASRHPTARTRPTRSRSSCRS